MKRVFDLVVGGCLLIGLAPVMLLIAILVRAFQGSPVLFRQIRPGLNGEPFELLKFRTMRDATDALGNPLSDEQRLTRFGQFLRSSSLDELPELINVLRGEMSLVGPRPLLMDYLSRYSPEQNRRHEVRPGITGWSQINGRNRVGWDERFQMDVWYVDHHNLALDLRILWKTFWKVIAREGVSAEGHVTMPPFQGASTHDRSLTDSSPASITNKALREKHAELLDANHP